MKNASFIKKLDWFTPFSKKSIKYQFQNIQRVSIIPQIDKDNFLLTVVTKTGTFELEIIQDFSNIGPKASKRKIKNQWKRYKRTSTKISNYNKNKNGYYLLKDIPDEKFDEVVKYIEFLKQNPS